MSDLDAKVKDFFVGYEQANAVFDAERLGNFYADNFIFAGPAGAQPVRKEEFLKVLPRRKEYVRSLGLRSSTIQALDSSELDSRYVMVKVVWKMRFERGAADSLDSRTSSTYLLSTAGDSFQIIFQVDHQDLAKIAQEFGQSAIAAGSGKSTLARSIKQ
jgi:hypothetical protein